MNSIISKTGLDFIENNNGTLMVIAFDQIKNNNVECIVVKGDQVHLVYHDSRVIYENINKKTLDVIMKYEGALLSTMHYENGQSNGEIIKVDEAIIKKAL
jgi:hypothetical protein